MKSVTITRDGSILPTASLGISLCLVALPRPFLQEQFEIGVDVLLELSDGLGRERVRHDFPLSCVLSTIPCIEQAPSDRHKGIIVLTGGLGSVLQSKNRKKG